MKKGDPLGSPFWKSYEDRLTPTSEWILFDNVSGLVTQDSAVDTVIDETTTGAYAINNL